MAESVGEKCVHLDDTVSRSLACCTQKCAQKSIYKLWRCTHGGLIFKNWWLLISISLPYKQVVCGPMLAGLSNVSLSMRDMGSVSCCFWLAVPPQSICPSMFCSSLLPEDPPVNHVEHWPWLLAGRPLEVQPMGTHLLSFCAAFCLTDSWSSLARKSVNQSLVTAGNLSEGPGEPVKLNAPRPLPCYFDWSLVSNTPGTKGCQNHPCPGNTSPLGINRPVLNLFSHDC